MSPHWITPNEFYNDQAGIAVYEKDVLDISLQGTNWLASFKRWWYDLFLLSYTDTRSRMYYCSSHAIRMDRYTQYRLYRTSIHPLSKFRNIWDSLLIYAVVLTMAIFYTSTSCLYGDIDWSYYFIGVILEFIILLDIYINSITGYVKHETRKIILNSKKILVHYGSSKLFAHVLSSLPLQSIMFIRYGKGISCNVCKANRFVATLEIISACRLYRLFDASRYWSQERESFKATYIFKLLRICVLGLTTMLIIMNLSDTITFLTIIRSNYVDERSYFASIFAAKYGRIVPFSNFMFISIEFARAFKSFLLFSFSLKPRVHFLDKMVSLFSYLVAMLFYMWSLVESYMFIGIVNFPKHSTIATVNRTMNLLRWRQLPNRFAMKIFKYYDFNMTKLSVIEAKNEQYKILPKCLKDDIFQLSYIRLIRRIPFFSEWPSVLIEEVVLLLQEEIYLDGDRVAEASVQGDGLIIIDVGILGVYSISNEEKGHLIDGDYFCELSLVTDKEIRMSSVVALTPCKVLFLEKFAFRKLMREYPQLFFNMQQQLTSKHKSKSKIAKSRMP